MFLKQKVISFLKILSCTICCNPDLFPDPQHCFTFKDSSVFRYGSTSGNVDPDPGSKKNRDKLAYKSNQIF